MSASHALAANAADVGDAMSVGAVAGRLGISDAGVHALAEAGLFWPLFGGEAFAGALVDNLAERIWRATLPTASAAPGVLLHEAVEGVDVGLWPAVITALLDGRINAFWRRGAFGEPILASLVVSSADLVADLARASDAPNEAPFIWTPTAVD